MWISMPHVLAVTEKTALIQCEYLALPQGSKFRSQQEYDVYKEGVKKKICDVHCGLARDAALRNPPIQLICVYAYSEGLGDPNVFLLRIEGKMQAT